MGCKVSGTSYYDCDFTSHSGRSVNDEECTIDASTKDVKHFVVVSPVIKKYSKIRVTGRIVADPSTANAKFVGACVLPNDIEWRDTKDISIADVTFGCAAIHYVSNGSENIETIIEELDRWNPNPVYVQIDQNDLTFTIHLS